MGTWVLREACRQAAEWTHAFPDLGTKVTVNVSARQLAEPDFRQTVASALAAGGLRPPLLCLELTEGTLLLDTVAAWARLREVKLLGVRLALDDFGTGFSSLSFVRQFSVDMIKIDRSFVQGVTMNAEDRAIVAAVAGLANGLGLGLRRRRRRDEGAGYRAACARLCACCKATSRDRPPSPRTSRPLLATETERRGFAVTCARRH